MDELRPEIRAAFEKEQAGLAPAAALRRNLVEAVAAQPRPARNFQWVAVAAAVLLAILVVAGLLSTRLMARHANVTNPQATPLADYGPPPAGVYLLYVHDPNHPTWLIGYDWSGHPRATVKPDQPAAIRMAPDGQSFALGLNAKGGTGELRDRLGQPVPGSGAIPGPAFPIWADDNQHMCGLSFDPRALIYTLVTVAPGEAAKSIAVTTRSQIGDQEVFMLASCSLRNDRAIIVRGNNTAPTEAWVVKISDGKIVSRNTYDAGLLSNVVGSADALLIAENSGLSVGQLGSTAPKTTIRKVSDRSVVATLDPSMGVLAFSSDNSLVLVTTTPWVGGVPVHLAVIELQSGRTIWSYSGPEQFGSSVAQPGGGAFALLFRPVGGQGPEADVVIVSADGAWTQLPRRYEPTW